MMKAVNAEILELALISTIADIQQHKTDEAVTVLKSTIDMLHECKSIKGHLKSLKNEQLLATLNQLFPEGEPKELIPPMQILTSACRVEINRIKEKITRLFPASTPEGTGDPSQTSPHS
jgi:hypothetical protein